MGHGRFVADIALPGMKHVALVASPYPSARIVSIKTDAALALPGCALCIDRRGILRRDGRTRDRRRCTESNALFARA
jgi:hypothetical protein